jgi:hypothetical protein
VSIKGEWQACWRVVWPAQYVMWKNNNLSHIINLAKLTREDFFNCDWGLLMVNSIVL